MLSEISQIEKDKNCIVSILCRIQKIKNKKVKLIETKSRKVIARGLGARGNKEELVKGYKLSVIK